MGTGKLDSCDVVQSHLVFSAISPRPVRLIISPSLRTNAAASEPNERHFRLLGHHSNTCTPVPPVCVARGNFISVYGRSDLAGCCLNCTSAWNAGSWLEDPDAPQRAWFSRNRAGLIAAIAGRSLDLRSGWELDAESRVLAEKLLHLPIGQLGDRIWVAEYCSGLRRFLGQQIESHIERKLITLPCWKLPHNPMSKRKRRHSGKRTSPEAILERSRVHHPGAL